MSSRFTPEELPLWMPGTAAGQLLATLERRTPLREASDLKSPEMMLEMCSRSEGTLGDLCDLFKLSQSMPFEAKQRGSLWIASARSTGSLLLSASATLSRRHEGFGLLPVSKDTLLRWKMKPEVDHGNEKAIQPRVQA